MISDELTRLIWMKTEDGVKGINPPKSIVSLILNNGEENTVNDGFQTVEEYEKARRILKKAAKIDKTNSTTLRFLREVDEQTGTITSLEPRRWAFGLREKEE